MFRELKLVRGLAFWAVVGLAAPSYARPVVTGQATPREIHLFKPPHEALRIEWSAVVNEEGGEFLVSRRTIQGAPMVVARLFPSGQVRYQVVDRAAAGAWIYQLRYRSRRGHERVLATIELNLDKMNPGRPHVAPEFRGPEAATLTNFRLGLRPAPVGWLSARDEAMATAMRGRPPTPPPRGGATKAI